MSAEEFVKHINNTEWDGEGNPVWHEDAVIKAINWFASQSSTPAGEDVEALAEQYFHKQLWDYKGFHTTFGEIRKEAFIAGYKAALQNKVPANEHEKQAEWEFVTILNENFEAAKIGDGSEWQGYTPQSAVLETYDDLFEIIKGLPLQRGDENKVPVECYEELINALDACFGVMMQPTYDVPAIGKWIIPCGSREFIEARAKAEKMYYEAKKTTLPNTTIK